MVTTRRDTDDRVRQGPRQRAADAARLFHGTPVEPSRRSPRRADAGRPAARGLRLDAAGRRLRVLDEAAPPTVAEPALRAGAPRRHAGAGGLSRADGRMA